MKNKIDLSSIKKMPKGNDTQFNKDTPVDLVESYTSTWGSTTEKVEEIPLKNLSFFELNGVKQPFDINQEKITQIKLSAKDIGIITPLIVRKVGNGYQIISGHHRFLVAKELGLLSVPCIVKNISDDVVYKYVTESNIQRLRIYPSEYGRIFSRYMELRQNIDITAQEIADKFGLSKKTMYRYINVTKLTNELQRFTDNDLISLDAVDIICQFSKENQDVISEVLTQTKKKIMVTLAKKIDTAIKDCNTNPIDRKVIENIIIGEKKSINDKPIKVPLSREVYSKYFNKKTSADEISNTIQKALEVYFNLLNQNK